MPKAEKGSIKDLGKRIKAKGLQKLKFWCEMCQKQCRDANGFKCHMQSESHLRQMKIFSENAHGIMDRKSKEFEKSFLDTLRMRHSTATVNANNVYQEVIQDRQHVHMNATMWATLSDFVKYLGKMGKCQVQETERGWYITYIERDVAKLAKQEAMQKRLEAEQAAEQALSERLERQRTEAAKAFGGTVETQATKLQRSEQDGTIQLALKKENTKKPSSKAVKSSVFEDDDDDDDDEEQPPSVPAPHLPKPPELKPAKKRPRMEDSMSKHKKVKQDDDPVDVWLHSDILVRIINKKLANGKYFKRKAAVDRLLDRYTAEVTVLDSDEDNNDGGDVLRLDQDDLETVVPKQTGKKVLLLRGKYRGQTAKIVQLDKNKYRAMLELANGKILERVNYDDISKVA